MKFNLTLQLSSKKVFASVKQIKILIQVPATQLEVNFCDEVKECLGISPTGSVTKFLNERGEWVEITGGGAVDSVNGQTGDVVLDADDINETVNRIWFATALKTAYDAAVAWISTNGSNILNHIASTSNPHNTTAAQVGAPSGSGTSTGTNTGDQDLSGLQGKRIVVSSNTFAVNDAAYTVTANTVFIDPTGVNGKGYSVLIRNGSATVGVTTYSTAGTMIWRVFNAGSWATYVTLDLGFTPENVANKATSFTTVNDTLYPSVEAVEERLSVLQRTGTSIAFDREANYGTIASPETGNITGDYTGAKIGVVQMIIHNNGTAPTIPATWQIKSGFYKVSQVNYILVEWISSNIAIYVIL